MKNQSRQQRVVGSAYRRLSSFFGNAWGCLVCLIVILQLGSAALGAAKPAFIQERDNQITSGTTSRATFSAPTTVGNLIVVYLIWDNTGSASVSDSLGNSYASALSPTRWSSGQYSTQIFYAMNIGSGGDTVTATFATKVSAFGIVNAHEYSGIRKTAPVDVTAAAAGTSGPLASGLATTTNDTDLLFAGAVSANFVTSPGAGYTARSTSQGNMTEDKIVSAKGPYSATASNSGGVWAIQMVAFKGVASGTSDTTPPSVPTNLSVTGTSASTVSLGWTASTDNVGVTGYKIYRAGVQTGTSGIASYTDTGLAASTTYSYTVSAYDAAGNNSAQTAPLNAAPGALDTQAPTASITSPANNQIVSGITKVAANAADNLAVVGVQFRLDGGSLGAEDTTSPYSTSWDTSKTTNGAHLLTVVARDAAGNKTTSTTVAVNVSNGLLRPYSTTFPLTENPISEGGNWINGRTDGVDWGDVQTTPGLAFGTNSGGYADSTALLSGSWGPDQMAQATVHSVKQTDSLYEEVELRLRSSISAHNNTGYEINFRCSKTSNAYSQIVRWNGPLGNFTYLWSKSGAQYGVANGNVVKATMIGNLITVYINDVQIGQTTDSTFPNGSPGMGFYQTGSSSLDADYGFTSFLASDGLTSDTILPSIPTNLSANALSSSQIDLSWTPSTDNVAVAGYQVFRDNTQIASASGTTLSDKTVLPGMQYTYAVSAFDAAGNVSPQSSPVVATTPSGTDTTPPSVPTNLQSSKVTSTYLTVSWSASTDNVAVAGYRIFRNGTQVGTTAATNYADTGLVASTPYSYTVEAYDGSNNVSAQSQALIVTTTAAAVTPPSIVQVNHNQISSGTSTSVAFNTPTLAGNTIVVYVIWSNAGTVALSDSHGDTFVNVGGPVTWGGGSSAQVFYASGIAGGTDTVTATFRTSVNSFGVVYVHEYAGISAINPVDVTTSASGSSASLNSGTATTTSANDLIFGAGVSDNVVTATGSGFTSRDLANGNITEDRIAGSIGSYAASATHNGTMWGMQMVAFRAAQ